MPQPIDFSLDDHGSLTVLTPNTIAAQAWIKQNISIDALTWGKGVVVEPRFVRDIVVGIQDDGMEVVFG